MPIISKTQRKTTSKHQIPNTKRLITTPTNLTEIKHNQTKTTRVSQTRKTKQIHQVNTKIGGTSVQPTQTELNANIQRQPTTITDHKHTNATIK